MYTITVSLYISKEYSVKLYWCKWIRPLLHCRSGVGAPVVGECDGEYNFDSRKSVLLWTLPVIDADNESGSMEFSIAGHPDDFFPVNVNFISKKSYCDLQVTDWYLLW